MSFRPIAIILALSLHTLTACESSGPHYKNVRSYSEGLAPIQAKNGRWGYVGKHQKRVISPSFEDAKGFHGGRAAVQQNGKWGFINRKGNWL